MATTTDTKVTTEYLLGLLAEAKTDEAAVAHAEGLVAGQFHRYSVNNLLLAAAQMPTMTQIAGYKKWLEVGRQVRKGEKALRIVAPIVRKDKTTGKDEVVGFRQVCVFDLSQTEPVEATLAA
jgi:hypothetical protein